MRQLEIVNSVRDNLSRVYEFISRFTILYPCQGFRIEDTGAREPTIFRPVSSQRGWKNYFNWTSRKRIAKRRHKADKTASFQTFRYCLSVRDSVRRSLSNCDQFRTRVHRRELYSRVVIVRNKENKNSSAEEIGGRTN